jgi:hypothetical protein
LSEFVCIPFFFLFRFLVSTLLLSLSLSLILQSDLQFPYRYSSALGCHGRLMELLCPRFLDVLVKPVVENMSVVAQYDSLFQGSANGGRIDSASIPTEWCWWFIFGLISFVCC